MVPTICFLKIILKSEILVEHIEGMNIIKKYFCKENGMAHSFWMGQSGMDQLSRNKTYKILTLAEQMDWSNKEDLNGL